MTDLPAPAPAPRRVLEERLPLNGLAGDPLKAPLPPSAKWHLHEAHFGKEPKTELQITLMLISWESVGNWGEVGLRRGQEMMVSPTKGLPATPGSPSRAPEVLES